jgi:hypothetical protein
MMLAIGLSYIAFITLRYIFLVLIFLEFLFWSGVESYQSLFLNLLRWSNGFVFAFANVLHYINVFSYVEPPLHLLDEADLV